MSEEARTEWLATYHQGDKRLRDKRHGILRLNHEKQRIEFAVQTAETDKSPIIIVNYPIRYLNDIQIIEKRQKMRKREYIQLDFSEPPGEMAPLFSFSLDNLEIVKEKIFEFKREMMVLEEKQLEKKSDEDIVEIFARLLMTPLEQFQQLIGEVTTRLKLLTNKPKKATKAFISALEPPKIHTTREIEINDRRVTFYESLETHSTILLLLSPIGGRIDDYYPMIDSLRGSFQIIIYGVRGYTNPIEQDYEFKLKKYIDDVKDFLNFIGQDKDIILGAHSLFSAIILEEFLDPKYTNIKKFVLISGVHRAPDTFRKGIKAMPHYHMWGPFKGQVKKIAPKILFSKDTDKGIITPFINQAFLMPDKVYYQVFKDFLPKFDYSSKVRSLKKPILALWGTNDQIITSELKAEIIEYIPQNLFSYKEIKGGHMIHLEYPNKVAYEINKFLSNKWSSIKIE
ncbi:MAG: alpha/beta fold hydrolase [Candidatus Hodarchaeota archaeon]